MRGLFAGVLIVFGMLPAAAPRAADAVLPQFSDDDHLGVVTCAGSTCHGAAKPLQDSTVLQNEFVSWHRQDKHSQAYKVLLNDDSKRIARNLGLQAAHEAKICLDCHSDYVPEDKRGKRFQLSDGVGCEACHGGAERYLGPHTSGKATHQENVDQGLYPSELPTARAKLCLSCHLGTKDKLATHRIMGAGHPRLSFELDTFTDIQPAHYVNDADYAKRKGPVNGSQVWAVGQAVAAVQYLDLFLDSQAKSSGLFPELFFFDCHSCHRPMTGKRWQPRSGTGLAPGNVRLYDANLLMLRHVAEVASPGQGSALRSATVALHKATTQGAAATRQAASRLRDVAAQVEAQVSGRTFSGADMKAVYAAIVAEALRGEYSDYSGAEQAAMGLGSLINAMRAAGVVSEQQSDTLNGLLDKAYVALQDDERFSPGAFVAALRPMQGAL